MPKIQQLLAKIGLKIAKIRLTDAQKETMIRESLLIIGFVSFVAGLWIIHPALALIVGGLALMKYSGLAF